MEKFKEWFKRYALAEVMGTATAIGGSIITPKLTNNEYAAAYGGAICENIGFYGTIISRDIKANSKKARDEGKPYGLPEVVKTARNLAIEFGTAECLDTLLIRPLAMGFGTKYLGREIGIFTGKVASDLIFYIPAIISREKIVKPLMEREK